MKKWFPFWCRLLLIFTTLTLRRTVDKKLKFLRDFSQLWNVFSGYQQFLAPGPPLTISSNVIPMKNFSCSGLYCFVCCVCKDVRLRTFLSLICQFVWSKPRRVSKRCWNEYFSFYELWCCCFLASVFLKTPSYMCV